MALPSRGLHFSKRTEECDENLQEQWGNTERVRWGRGSESKSPWGNSQTPLPQLILSLKISSWQINVPEGRLPRDRNAPL